MITLHRLGHQVEAFQLNPDLIMTVEATPDTVITLTNGHKVVVAESPERIVEDWRLHRIDVLAGAMDRRDVLRRCRTEGQLHNRPSLRVASTVTPLPIHQEIPTA